MTDPFAPAVVGEALVTQYVHEALEINPHRQTLLSNGEGLLAIVEAPDIEFLTLAYADYDMEQLQLINITGEKNLLLLHEATTRITDIIERRIVATGENFEGKSYLPKEQAEIDELRMYPMPGDEDDEPVSPSPPPRDGGEEVDALSAQIHVLRAQIKELEGELELVQKDRAALGHRFQEAEGHIRALVESIEPLAKPTASLPLKLSIGDIMKAAEAKQYAQDYLGIPRT